MDPKLEMSIELHPSMPKDCPFVPPNLPSRCTWKPNADRKDCPHTKEEV